MKVDTFGSIVPESTLMVSPSTEGKKQEIPELAVVSAPAMLPAPAIVMCAVDAPPPSGLVEVGAPELEEGAPVVVVDPDAGFDEPEPHETTPTAASITAAAQPMDRIPLVRMAAV
jgi:hypothetical protein